MPTAYKYQGLYLTDFIAVELAVELFAGMNDVPIKEIRDEIDKIHVSRGGLHKTFDPEKHPASKATYVLSRMGFTSKSRQRYWSFDSVDNMIKHLESLK